MHILCLWVCIFTLFSCKLRINQLSLGIYMFLLMILILILEISFVSGRFGNWFWVLLRFERDSHDVRVLGTS